MADRNSHVPHASSQPSRFDEARWRELLPLFDHAMDLEGSAREIWLSDLARERPQIAASLRALLSENEQLEAAHFLEKGAMCATRNSLRSALDAILAKAFRKLTP